MRIRALGIVLVFWSATAFAQQRSFVSTSGVDSAACTRQAPCRNFAAGIGAVADGGEVVALDSGGYGVVSITKAVSLIAPAGVHAAITATSGDAVSINAPGVVVLRGLYLTSLGGVNGVNNSSTPFVQIESVVFNGFSGAGLRTQTLSDTAIAIRDSEFRNNHRGIDGVLGHVDASIERTRFDKTEEIAMRITSGSTWIVRDTSFFMAGNAIALAPVLANIRIMIDRCVISNAGVGISGAATATGTALAQLSNTTIVETTMPLQKTGDVATNQFKSFGNNKLASNGSAAVFDGTINEQ